MSRLHFLNVPPLLKALYPVVFYIPKGLNYFDTRTVLAMTESRRIIHDYLEFFYSHYENYKPLLRTSEILTFIKFFFYLISLRLGRLCLPHRHLHSGPVRNIPSLIVDPLLEYATMTFHICHI